MALVGGDPVEVPAFRGTGSGIMPGQGVPQGRYDPYTGEYLGPSVDPFTGQVSRTPSTFQLGWDPQNARAIGQSAANAQGNAGQMAAGASGAGAQLAGLASQTTAGMGQTAQNYGGAGQGIYRSQAGAVDQRNTPQANFNPATQAIANQQGIAAQLANAANRTTDSGAQAQLRQGIDEAIASQMAIARSGSGFGANAAGLNQAAGGAGALIGQQASQSALLKAQTDQADAARQLQALGAAGEQYGAAGGAQAQMASRAAELQLAGLTANDARAQALSELAHQYGSEGFQGQMAAQQLGLESAFRTNQQTFDQMLAAQGLGLEAGQQRLGAEGLELQGANLALGGREAYESALNQIYGIDKGVELGNRQLENDADMQNLSAILGTIGTGAAIVGGFMSDRRAKTNIEHDSLRRRYAALSGAQP